LLRDDASQDTLESAAVNLSLGGGYVRTQRGNPVAKLLDLHSRAEALTEAAKADVKLGKALAPDRAWPDPRLFDLLNVVVRKEPASSAARSGRAEGHREGAARAGLIGTSWTDGPTDGLGAMVGA
jgi:hypothetical protein